MSISTCIGNSWPSLMSVIVAWCSCAIIVASELLSLYHTYDGNTQLLKPGQVAQSVTYLASNRCESDCRSSGREVAPGPVPFFSGD